MQTAHLHRAERELRWSVSYLVQTRDQGGLALKCRVWSIALDWFSMGCRAKHAPDTASLGQTEPAARQCCLGSRGRCSALAPWGVAWNTLPQAPHRSVSSR